MTFLKEEAIRPQARPTRARSNAHGYLTRRFGWRLAGASKGRPRTRSQLQMGISGPFALLRLQVIIHRKTQRHVIALHQRARIHRGQPQQYQLPLTQRRSEERRVGKEASRGWL